MHSPRSARPNLDGDRRRVDFPVSCGNERHISAGPLARLQTSRWVCGDSGYSHSQCCKWIELSIGGIATLLAMLAIAS